MFFCLKFSTFEVYSATLQTCCATAVFLIFILSCSLQLTPLPSPAQLLLLCLIAIAFTLSPPLSPSLLPLPLPQDTYQALTPTPSLLLFSSSCAFLISQDRSLSIPQELFHTLLLGLCNLAPQTCQSTPKLMSLNDGHMPIGVESGSVRTHV